jgi:AcrR family transcriptional regulator
MKKAVQTRTLETRARLIAAARELVGGGAYEALRVEDVVQRAGVAKGTFFAHFTDKDTLMDQLIGERLDGLLDVAEAGPAPRDAEAMTDRLMPFLEFIAANRSVFDLVLRCAGSLPDTGGGVIARIFNRHGRIAGGWLEAGPFRKDVPAATLVEGIQAFSVHAVSLSFCAVHNVVPLRARFSRYLAAWVAPPA